MNKSLFRKLFQFVMAVTFISFQSAHAQSELKSASTVDGDGSSLYKFAMDQKLGLMMHVKFVVFLDAQKNPSKLVFQNSNSFPFHSDFLMTTKEFAGKTRPEIDELTLKDTPNRKALLGTLFKHSQSGQFDLNNIINDSFELVTSDIVPSAQVHKIQEMLLKSSPETLEEKTFAYLASGPNKQAIIAQTDDLKSAGVRVFDIFKNKDYQAYVQGWSVGKIKVVRADELEQILKTGEITPETILVADKVPREIPPIKGLISAEPTAMSSHVVLLAEMFQIPFAADKNVMEKAAALDGKYVYMNVGASSISRLNTVDAKTYSKLSLIKSKKPLSIAVDFSKIKISSTADLTDADISAYGGKAVRLGLIKRQIAKNAPDYSVGIPVFYFKKYVETTVTLTGALLKDVINGHLTAIQQGGLNYAEITAHLSEIRKVMKETKVPAPMVQDIHQQISKLIPKSITRVKLRSSSNVEDGTEFNGAGLYDSEGVWLNEAPVDKADDFAKGLNKIWRSFYSDRGFLARQTFKVDESKAAMGILVQETFKEELANGVSLWTPSPNDWEGNTAKVIGFPGEESSVTNPTTPDQPEIVFVRSSIDDSTKPPTVTWNADFEQRTNLLPVGQTMMEESFYVELAQLMDKVALQWPGGAPKSGLDFEWKQIIKNGKKQILIKQVRPLVNSKSENLPDGANMLVVGGFEEALEVNYSEDVDAYGQHFCPQKMSVTMPTFSDKDFAAPVVIPSLKMSLRDKDYEFKNVNAIGKYTNEDDQRKYSLEMTVDTDVYKGLRVVFQSSPYQEESTKVVDIYSGSVQGSVKDLALAKKFFSAVETYSCGYSSPFDYGFTNQLDPKNAVSIMNAELKIKDGSFLLHGEYNLKTGFDKTAHYILTDTTVKGFGLKKDAKVNTPRASVYAGGHHNFMWGVSIDMAGSNLSEAEKQEFYKKFGRYLLMNSGILGGPGGKGGTQAVWMKPDGTLGKPFKATWTYKQ